MQSLQNAIFSNTESLVAPQCMFKNILQKIVTDV